MKDEERRVTIQRYALILRRTLFPLPFSLLADHVKPAVGHQHLGDANTFGGLVVLENCRKDSRESQCRAVQRMAQLYLLGE